MLNTHDSLRIVEAIESARGKDFLVLNIGNADGDGLVRGSLETLYAVPRHILNREHGAVCEDVKVQFSVRARQEISVSRVTLRGNNTYTKTRFVASIILGRTP